MKCVFEHAGKTYGFDHGITVRSDGTSGPPYQIYYRLAGSSFDKAGTVITLDYVRYDVVLDQCEYRVVSVYHEK